MPDPRYDPERRFHEQLMNEPDSEWPDFATRVQLPPRKNTKPDVTRLVIDDMRSRGIAGKEKYGVPLQPMNGRDPLIDAYQEAIDLCKYLRQELYEKYGK